MMGHERLLRQPTSDKRTVKTKKWISFTRTHLQSTKPFVDHIHRLWPSLISYSETLTNRLCSSGIFGSTVGQAEWTQQAPARGRSPESRHPELELELEEPGEAATGLKRGRSAAKKTLSPAKPLNPSPSPLASALIRATCSGWRRSRLHDDPPQARVAAARHCRRRRRLFFSP